MAAVRVRRLSLMIVLALLAGCGLTAPDRAPPQIAGAERVVVERGDTVYSLAEEHGVPLRDFIEANALEPPFTLHPGDVLQLPLTRVHVVERGESLSEIAERYDARVADLVQLNGLESPDHILAGQRLRLPPAAGTGPQRTPDTGVRVAAAPPTPAASADQPSGPRRLTEAAPADAGSPAGSPERSGQPTRLAPRQLQGIDTEVLRPEDAGREDPAPDETVADAAAGPASRPGPTSLRPATPSDPPADAAESAPPAPAPPVEADAPSQPSAAPPPEVAAVPAESDAPFQWPVQGRLVGRFGPTGAGGHNDGIDIAAEAGTPIVAAADGEVAYAGNELRGYGNLLLIRHADGWVTAYAHTDRMLVDRGDQVVAGQVIATVGRSGSISQPMLHFEIRRGSAAVDPLGHLP